VTIATARLDLVPLSLPLLEALVAGGLAGSRALASYAIDDETFAGDEHVLRLRREGAVRCLASVSPDSAPSLATIATLGFVHTGEQVDEIDGLELVHTLELR
jgi:hypothetical protein